MSYTPRQPFIPASWKDPAACPPRDVNTNVIPPARVIPDIDSAAPLVWSRLPRDMSPPNDPSCIKFDAMALTALQVNGKKYAAANGIGHTGCTAATFLDLSLYTCVDFKVEPCSVDGCGTDANCVKTSMQVWVNAGTVIYTSIDLKKNPSTQVKTYLWPTNVKGVDAGKNKRDLLPGTAPLNTTAGFWQQTPATPYDLISSTNPLVRQSRAAAYGGTKPATDTRDEGMCISLPSLPAVIVWKPPAWIPQWLPQEDADRKGEVVAYPLAQTLNDAWVVIATVDVAGTISQVYCGGPVQKFNLDYPSPGPYVRLEVETETAPYTYTAIEAFRANGVLVEHIVATGLSYRGGSASASGAATSGFMNREQTEIEWCNEERGGTGGSWDGTAPPGYEWTKLNFVTNEKIVTLRVLVETAVTDDIRVFSGTDSQLLLQVTDAGVLDLDYGYLKGV